jgi:hypothetical protein
MWRRVDIVWTDVSEEHIASISRVEISASEEPEWAGGCGLQVSFLLCGRVSFGAYCFNIIIISRDAPIKIYATQHQ